MEEKKDNYDNGPETKDLNNKLFDFFYFLNEESNYIESIELITSLLLTKKDAENIFGQIDEILEDLEEADCDKILKAMMLANHILKNKEKGLKIYQTVIGNRITKFEELLDKIIQKNNEEKMGESIINNIKIFIGLKISKEIRKVIEELKEKLSDNKFIEIQNRRKSIKDELIDINEMNKDNLVTKKETLKKTNSLNEVFEKLEIIQDRSKEEHSRVKVPIVIAKEEKISINYDYLDDNKVSEIDSSKNIENNPISEIQIDNISRGLSTIHEFPNTLQATKNFDSDKKFSEDIIDSKGENLNIIGNLENFSNNFSSVEVDRNSLQLVAILENPLKNFIEETKYIEEELLENINVIFNTKSKIKEISFVSINLLLKYLIQDKEFHNIDRNLIKAFILQKSGIINNNNFLEIIYSIYYKYNSIHSSNNIMNNGLGVILINLIYYRYEDEIYNNFEFKCNILKILEKLAKKLPKITLKNRNIELSQLINLLKSDDNSLNDNSFNNTINSERYTNVLKIKKFLDLEETFLLNQKLMKNQYNNNERILPGHLKEYFDLTQWSEVEIARQITLITHFIFSSITPKELINSRWTKHDKHIESPNVVKMIDRFNKISFWVCEEILAYDKAEHRSKIIEKFILIANEFRNMNNFNDAFAVIIALNSFQIKSLEKSWNKISLERVVIFKDLDELFSYSKNYGLLRAEMEKVNNEPCIPYLGYFLKELAFLDEGPKYIKEPNLVNVEKIIKTQKILEKIIKLQAFDYRYKPVYKLSFLADPIPLNEDQLTEISGRLEPFFNLSHKKSKSKRLTKTDLKDQSLNSTFKNFIIFYNRYSFDLQLRDKIKLLTDWE